MHAWLVRLVVAGWLAAPGAANAPRPLYYDRVVTEEDLAGRSADELRLMRNTIFARAGRTFDDPALREHFARQPWYRPAAGPPRKLSAIDQKNLAGIKLWETHAKALDGLEKLVPGLGGTAPKQPQCAADAREAARGKGERQLVREAGKLPWASVPNYGDAGLEIFGTKMKAVRVDCGPDIDGDGSPEAVVTLTHQYDVPAGEENPDPDRIGLIFLASLRGKKWRPVVPLGIDGRIPGIEGFIATSIRFVTLADGRRALVVQRTWGGGGDCACDSETTSVETLEQGKLKTRGTFETGRPCMCEYAGSD